MGDTFQSQLGICHHPVRKKKEILWPTPQNGESCLICCSPFGPKGTWILGTCQHMYHPQCLIILMVARKRCPQCRARFHWRLYGQLNLWMAMPQHWEYNRLNTPNRSQAWGAYMKWIWNVDMFVITWGNQYGEWQYEESMIQKACELLYLLMIDTWHCWFYQMFWGWYNPRTNEFEYSLNLERT